MIEINITGVWGTFLEETIVEFLLAPEITKMLCDG